MSKKGETIKPGKLLSKGNVDKPPAQKRTHSDVSNCSMEELSVLSHQLEGLSEDVRLVREDLKTVMKKEQLEIFIKETVSRIISDMNENIDLVVELKLEEKIRPMKEKIEEIVEDNHHLNSEVKRLKEENKTLKKHNEENESRSKLSLAKSNYNEQYSRKNNLKIMKLGEKQHETEETLIQDVCKTLQKKGVALDPIKIMAIHRIPGKEGEPKPVLIKLMNNNEKSKIMKTRAQFKADGKRLVDDVTKMNTELIKRLLQHRDIDQAWYFNGSVYGKTVAGKRCKFDVFDDIEAVLRS